MPRAAPSDCPAQEVTDMAGSVARVTEISAKSDISFEDAIKIGVDRAAQTLRGLTSAWVKEQEVEISDGRITSFKVNLLVTFVLE
jgi:flavin-binding protein dodecin